jgi:hypothetical protein
MTAARAARPSAQVALAMAPRPWAGGPDLDSNRSLGRGRSAQAALDPVLVRRDCQCILA